MTEPSLDLSSTAPVAAPEPATREEPAAGGAAGTATATLTLEPPQPVTAIPDRQAEDVVKLDPAQTKKLDDMVSTYLDAVTSLDTHDQAFTDARQRHRQAGRRRHPRLGQRFEPAARQADGGDVERRHQPGRHRQSLTLSLRQTVEDLDPQKQGDLLSPRKLLGVIPFGDRLADYFHKYQSSQAHINAIIVSLYDGQDELRRDNADIEQEKVNLWATMGRLRQYAYLAEQLDKGLTERIAADRGDRSRSRQGAQGRPAVLRSARSARTCSPSSRSASRATSRST